MIGLSSKLVRAMGISLLFSVVPLAANAQSRADSVGLLVQAALVAIDSIASDVPILLDPRPELREDSLSILVFDALSGLGFEEYKEPGIPTSSVWLLSPGGFWGENESTHAFATFWGFSRREGFLNTSSNTLAFPVECHEGSCVLGQRFRREHGDGHLSAECWDDFFARTVEGRKECSGIRPEPGSTSRWAADIS